jgi:hypothetical protein
VAGSLGILVSAFLPWISANGSQSGSEVPLPILWNLSADPEGPKLGFALCALGAGGLALSFVPRTAIVRRVLGGLAMLVAIAFAVQVFRAVDQLGGDLGDAFDVLGVAAYVALAGGLLLTSSR